MAHRDPQLAFSSPGTPKWSPGTPGGRYRPRWEPLNLQDCFILKNTLWYLKTKLYFSKNARLPVWVRVTNSVIFSIRSFFLSFPKNDTVERFWCIKENVKRKISLQICWKSYFSSYSSSSTSSPSPLSSTSPWTWEVLTPCKIVPIAFFVMSRSPEPYSSTGHWRAPSSPPSLKQLPHNQTALKNLERNMIFSCCTYSAIQNTQSCPHIALVI